MDSRNSEFKINSIAFTWALAGVMHLLTFSWILPFSWAGALYLLATLSLLLRPSSISRFATFLAATAIVLFRNYEVLANHLVLEFWIIASLLAAGLVKLPSLRRREVDLETLFQQLAPLVRIPYLLLFGFAIFSKLNSDFLNPGSSCASLFATRIIEAFYLDTLSFGFLSPSSQIIGYAAIYLTLAFEIIIPCLLIVRRTRLAGIYLALVFHFLVGLVPILGISSFSSLSLALLIFFFPNSALDSFNHKLSSLTNLLSKGKHTQLLFKAIVIITVLLLLGIQHRYFHPTVGFANTIWALTTVPLIWTMLRSLAESRSPTSSFSTQKPKTFFIPTPKALAFLNLPVLLLGSLPYFAIQTQGSFTMFSNLRILGDRPNHFIVETDSSRSSPKLIKILGTNHPNLNKYPDSNTLITGHELQRKIASTKGDFHVLCEYKNEVVLIGRFGGELTLHPLLEPPINFASRFLRFRDVPTNELCECTW